MTLPALRTGRPAERSLVQGSGLTATTASTGSGP
jgi:hypothetical protein